MQSFLQVYGQGSGADCRRHVQKLNMMKGTSEQSSMSSNVSHYSSLEQQFTVEPHFENAEERKLNDKKVGNKRILRSYMYILIIICSSL